MRAIEEVGIKKTFKYFVYSLCQVIYSILIFPPLKKIYLGLMGARIGKNSLIMNVKFFNWHQRGPRGFVVGDNCFIGDESLIDLSGRVTLENNVTIAQRVTILTHLNVGYKNHPLQKQFPSVTKEVILKEGSVVGAASTILAGVTIGEKSFVAAGSVVTKNVDAKTLVAGVPARLVRKIK